MTVTERNPTPSNRLGLDGLEFVEFTTVPAAGPGRPAREDGISPGGPAPLARGPALPSGRHEPRGQRAPRRGARGRRGRAGDRRGRDGLPGGRRGRGPSADRGARRVGPAHPRRGDGAAHPRHPRRRRQPHLLRRSAPRLLDLRRRLHADRRRRPASAGVAGLHYFGVVQTAFPERTAAWLEFYQSLFGFTVLPSGTFFGVVNKGVLLESPCRKFFLQLIEPPEDAGTSRGRRACCASGWARPTVPAAIAGPAGTRASSSSTAAPSARPIAAPSPSSTPAACPSSWCTVTWRSRGRSSDAPRPTSAWTRSRWPARSRPSCGPCGPPDSRRSCCPRGTWSATPTARPPPSPPCGRADCGSPASRSCATSRA